MQSLREKEPETQKINLDLAALVDNGAEHVK